MKIIVAGSREVTDYNIVRQAFIHSGFWRQYRTDIEVISGTARGVDRLGEEFAERNGLRVHRFPADWDKYGKAAGHIRNKEMGKFAKAHDGRLLAIWDGNSLGTKQMIDFAIEIGLGGFIYRTDKPVRYNAKVGDKVRTDFSGKFTEHTIVSRLRDTASQSGVVFQVTPAVPKSGGKDVLIDADWFELIKEEE
jgi:hypothetical protein